MYSILDVLVIDNSGNVGIGTNKPLTTLDLSQQTDGILLPRSTTIANPRKGMIYYNSSNKTVQLYTDKWIQLNTINNISLLSISNNTINAQNLTVTVTGTNFESTLQWIIIGLDGTKTYPTIQFINATSVNLIFASALLSSNNPYRILVHSLITGLDYISSNESLFLFG